MTHRDPPFDEAVHQRLFHAGQRVVQREAGAARPPPVGARQRRLAGPAAVPRQTAVGRRQVAHVAEAGDDGEEAAQRHLLRGPRGEGRHHLAKRSCCEGGEDCGVGG